MKRVHILFIFLVATGGVAPGTVYGQGFYLGFEMGGNFVPGINTTGSGNDRASVGDEYINPLYATVTQTAGYEDYNITGSDRGVGGGWNNSFADAAGMLFGFVLGYRAQMNYLDLEGVEGMEKMDGMKIRLRPEFEYFYRSTRYDQTSDIPFATGVQGDKIRQEIQIATDRIGTLTGHNFFGNLYLDFTNNSRFTPYAGFGAGIAPSKMEYTSVWARNADPNAISTGEGLPNVEEIRRNLAGSTSVAQDVLSDSLFGYEVLFGVDYQITKSLSIGVKGRWVHFSSFQDEEGYEWNPLRSHVPNLRRDGSEPVSGSFKTDEIETLGFSLSLKYHF